MERIKDYMIGILIGLLAGAFLFLLSWNHSFNNEEQVLSDELVECIANNSFLYTQLGCHACEKQEEIFGDKFDSLNVIDCF